MLLALAWFIGHKTGGKGDTVLGMSLEIFQSSESLLFGRRIHNV